MGLLTNFFSKKRYPSFVRKWAIEQRRKTRHSDDISLDELFAALIIGVSSFGKDTKPFSGDATLFEVACYMFFEIDLWLYNNQFQYRKEVTSYFIHKNVNLFSNSLQTENIDELISERFAKYGEIAIKNNSAESYIDLLSEFVRRTKHNKLPQKIECQNADNYFNESDDLWDDVFGVKMELSIYVQNMLPATYQVLNSFFNIDSQRNGNR